MKDPEHRLGVSEVNLVVRHLKLDPNTDSDIEPALEEIDEIYGLDGVSFDQTSQVLNIAYDASRVSIEGIEAVLQKHGIEVAHDWWTHFKESYYRFVDQNVKDYARHAPWSCHQAPQGKKKKS